MLKTCLFDLDGTITDPKEGITKSVAYALDKFHINVENLEVLVPFIGPPLLDSFIEYYHMSEDEAKQAIEYYREYFRKQGIFENFPYHGIDALLQYLNEKGIQCIIATSKPEEFANKILKHFHLDSYFEDVCGATMDGSRSKKGDVIAYALQKHSLDKHNTIMIGDRKHDIIGGKEHGLKSIGVLYGYGDYDELSLASADFIVKNIDELKENLDKLRL